LSLYYPPRFLVQIFLAFGFLNELSFFDVTILLGAVGLLLPQQPGSAHHYGKLMPRHVGKPRQHSCCLAVRLLPLRDVGVTGRFVQNCTLRQPGGVRVGPRRVVVTSCGEVSSTLQGGPTSIFSVPRDMLSRIASLYQ
jgi:hypothetical protein